MTPTPLFRSIEHLTAHQIPDPPTPFCNILPDLPIVDRENLLITLCTDKSVLHLGCSNYPFTEKKLASGTLLHAKLNKIASRCHGVDCEASSLSILKKAFPSASFFHGNVEKLDELVPWDEYNIIVAGEILEHLNNPGLFLKAAAVVLGSRGTLVITVPNCFARYPYLLISRGIEFVNQDHNYWFSYQTLSNLLRKSGYKIDKSWGYVYNHGSNSKEIAHHCNGYVFACSIRVNKNAV